MNTADLIYKIIQFFFNDIGHFTMLIVLIAFMRGSFIGAVKKVKANIDGVMRRYRRNALIQQQQVVSPRAQKEFARMAPAPVENGPDWLKNKPGSAV